MLSLSMNSILVPAVCVLSILGGLLAVVLFFVARQFAVIEDPRIDQVEEILPGANCGGCGQAGCRAFAEVCVKAETLEGAFCPVGGNETMEKVAEVLGKTVEAKKPMVAVLRCGGTLEKRPRNTKFDGYPSCAVSAALFQGETACRYGCLGFGDCVDACAFDAIHLNPVTGLVEVDQEKCTGCGACTLVCPKSLLELRDKGRKDRRVFVSCRSQDKGGAARKACKAACIGCGKCAKACKFDAIVLENNLAYIDFQKCKLCRKCVEECPTGAIWAVNFPPPKPKKAAPPKDTKKETVAAGGAQNG